MIQGKIFDENKKPIIKQGYGICTNPEYNKPIFVFEIRFDALFQSKEGVKDYLHDEKRYVIAYNHDDAREFLLNSFRKPYYQGDVYALDNIHVNAAIEVRGITPTMRKILHLALKDDKRVLRMLEADENKKMMKVVK